LNENLENRALKISKIHEILLNFFIENFVPVPYRSLYRTIDVTIGRSVLLLVYRIRLSLRPREGCEVLWWVCLSVCLSTCISQKPHGGLSNFFAFAWVRGSVLIWRRCDALCTSALAELNWMDDPIPFSWYHTGRAVCCSPSSWSL